MHGDTMSNRKLSSIGVKNKITSMAMIKVGFSVMGKLGFGVIWYSQK